MFALKSDTACKSDLLLILKIALFDYKFCLQYEVKCIDSTFLQINILQLLYLIFVLIKL